ncbi:MAG: hypothetical protein GX861_04160, partial [Tenericutes bacterium]|nr:hypothetical protein [Mycoplasmatota bacterium]
MKKKNYFKTLRKLKNILYATTLMLIVLIMTTGTKTLAETPANPVFTDYNFYKCVVDAYNSKNKTSLPYTTNLTDTQLETITSLSCYGFNKPEIEKISNASGIEKLTLLTTLDLDNNNLSSIDLSSNPALTTLYLSNNNLSSIDLSTNPALTEL